jgi:hypothetical protein
MLDQCNPPPDTKTCAKCGETKPVTQFYRDVRARDGRQGRCKACSYAIHRAWVQTNKEHSREYQRVYLRATKDHRRAVARAYYQAKPGSFARHHAAYYQANRERQIAYAAQHERAWTQANPGKARLRAHANQAIYRAIKRGKMTRPTTCEECGHERRIEAAHKDYSRPLDVRWLCRPCHVRWDHTEPKLR